MNFRWLFVVLLFFCEGSSAADCVKEGGSVAVDGGACTKYKNTLLVEEQSLRVKMEYKITLQLGGCQINGKFTGVRTFSNGALDNPQLPATFDVTDRGIKVGQKSLPNCGPKFNKTADGRYTIDILYEAEGGQIPGFLITFQDSKIYTGVQPAGKWETSGWRLWVTIGVVLFVIAVIVVAIVGIVWYNKNKKKEEKAADKDQPACSAATKSKSRSTSVKTKAKKTEEDKSSNKTTLVNIDANNRSVNLDPNWARSFQWNANDYTENGFARLRALFEGPIGSDNMRLILRYHPLNQQQVDGFTNLRFRYCHQVDPEVSGYPTGTAVYLRMKQDISLINDLLALSAQIADKRN
ncbi:hypothetical protein M3Y98_00709000 [Aphelenchoides besseyi]|nr:hypothetical protein M3Y98_00709000 [Aphelenchoides besseyi]